jgi:hypothetical protein
MLIEAYKQTSCLAPQEKMATATNVKHSGEVYKKHASGMHVVIIPHKLQNGKAVCVTLTIRKWTEL